MQQRERTEAKARTRQEKDIQTSEESALTQNRQQVSPEAHEKNIIPAQERGPQRCQAHGGDARGQELEP